MLDHGRSVHEHYKQLIGELESGTFEDSTTLMEVYRLVRPNLPPPEVLHPYHEYHDCGKHLVLTVEDGKRRFPNHAEASAQQYAHLFPEDGFTIALIRRDMDFHMLRGDDIDALWKSPFAPILYLTAWAEINANAEMFGGRCSESYKIKRSRLIQAGKKFLNSIKEI